MKEARVANLIYETGRVVETVVNREGFYVAKELTGHGIGRKIHESPVVPNYPDSRSKKSRMTPGLVIAVEPIICAGKCRTVLAADNWTIKTTNGLLAVHYEHTIVVTDGDPILLTSIWHSY